MYSEVPASYVYQFDDLDNDTSMWPPPTQDIEYFHHPGSH